MRLDFLLEHLHHSNNPFRLLDSSVDFKAKVKVNAQEFQDCLAVRQRVIDRIAEEFGGDLGEEIKVGLLDPKLMGKVGTVIRECDANIGEILSQHYGCGDDNMFQIEGAKLEEQLERSVAAGKCSMRRLIQERVLPIMVRPVLPQRKREAVAMQANLRWTLVFT